MIQPFTKLDTINTIEDLQAECLDLGFRLDCGYVSKEDYDARSAALNQIALEFIH